MSPPVPRPRERPRWRTAAGVAIVLLLAAVAGCDADYPRVVVVNRIGADVLIRDPSFNGCRWTGVLGYGDHTAPDDCLPGGDRVHFAKLDLSAADASGDAAPPWFNYQTVRSYRADVGDFLVVEITGDGLEQDFSTPGPFGH